MPAGADDFQNTGEVLIDEDAIALRVDELAARLSPLMDDNTVAVALMDGAFLFAADLMRALSRRGHNLAFDQLRLSSYGDTKSSKGHVDMLQGLARPVKDRQVLVLDDVFETGNTLMEAVKQLKAAGASDVITAVFAYKALPGLSVAKPDFYAWDAPQRFLVGYGLDYRAYYRGQGFISALD